MSLGFYLWGELGKHGGNNPGADTTHRRPTVDFISMHPQTASRRLIHPWTQCISEEQARTYQPQQEKAPAI